MTDVIDLSDESEATDRDHLFAALDSVDAGETRRVRAPDDVEHLLYRYQIVRERGLDWTDEQAGPDVWVFAVTKQAPLDGDALVEFDVRGLPPQQRHTVLLATFDNLSPGQGFVLVNDHDPKPLSYELRSTRGDVFEWEYRGREAGEWTVEIVKTDTAETDDGEVLTTFDVREIPKRERHPAIHHRYGMIPEGATIEIVAPHEPEPLRREFQQRYGDTFSWDIADHDPGRCRVHVTKESSSTDGEAVPGNETATPGCQHHGRDTAGHHDAETVADDAPAQDDVETALTVTHELDVRQLPPAQRHEQIFDAYADLEGGEGFVLVNDHDPKPLYHQFDAEGGPEFSWTYRQREPGEFRVCIGKDETAEGGSPQTEQPESPF